MAGLEWGSLVRLSRHSLNLTQEDFAADLGRSRSLIAQWESGRRPVPRDMRRVALDILGGYYKRHIDAAAVARSADEFSGYSSVVRAGYIGLYANGRLNSCWVNRYSSNYAESAVLKCIPKDNLVSSLSDNYTMNMLSSRARFAKIFMFEKSILVDGVHVLRDVTRVNIGIGPVLFFRETPRVMPAGDASESWAAAITMDGTVEVIVGNPPPGSLISR